MYFMDGVVDLRVFISPLGFHEDVVLKLLVDYRAEAGDRLFVITCGLTGAVKAAFDSLKALCSRQGFPEPELIDLDCNNIYGSLRLLSEKIGGIDAEKFILEIGAGLRIAGYLALFTLVKHGKVFEIHYRSENTNITLTIPWRYLSVLFKGLSTSERQVLELVVNNPGLTIKDLALMLDRKEKSVRNIVSMLKSKGLIDKRGPREALYPTDVALALI